MERGGIVRIPAKSLRATLASVLLLTTAAPALSQDGAAGEARAIEVETLSDPDEGQYPILLDGTLSGEGDLKDDTSPNSGRLRFDGFLGPWTESKARFRERTGISFGGSYMLLGQKFSDPGLGEDESVGQKLTLNFSTDIIGRGTPNPVTLDLVLEKRGPVGTENPPLTAGVLAGSLTPTAPTYGDFDFGVTQFYIRQNLAGNRFQYAIGKLFAPNFINAYPLFDDNRQFFNQAFSTSPTIPAPLRGFGAVAVWYPTDSGAYIQGGVFTANSDDIGVTVDNFFEDGELFYNVELGWSGLARTGVPVQARGPMDTNNVHLSFWHKDAQPDADPLFQREAQGVALNANYMVDENTMVFLRGGVSDGWVTERNVSAGFGWRPSAQSSDLFGAGVGWVQPESDFLDEQVVTEVFYRYHLTPNFAITPGFQHIANPTLNPSVDELTVMSLRMRVTF